MGRKKKKKNHPIAELGLAAERGPGGAVPVAVPGVAAALSLSPPTWQLLLFVFAAGRFITAGNTQVFSLSAMKSIQ